MSESLFEQYKAALRRGHMAALAGELDEALEAYDAAASLVPERALPLASRGTVLHRLDRWPEAAEAFDRALQLAPDDEAALRARATARAERDLRSGAAADFERLAVVLDVAGRAGPAAAAASRAAELEPTDSRVALAERLRAGVAEPAAEPAGPDGWADPIEPAEMGETDDEPDVDQSVADAPGTAARDERPLEDRDAPESAAYDILDALRAGMDADAPDGAATDGSGPDADADIDAAAVAIAGGETITDELPEDAGAAEGTQGTEGADGGAWPPIDLPSPPPPPMVGPPPDPEDLLAEAALVLEAGEVDAARDLLLTAASVHRAAGRIDAALDVCLNLLSIAPGDPRVHLAIANLQLDRGWSAVAKEKLDLLVRLTSLTGDTQAEADVHGLASERLRDDPAAPAAAR